MGALILGVYEGKDLVYIGNTGGGFNAKTLSQVHARLEPLMQKTCPFKTRPKTRMTPHWVKPELVCEIAFQNWTADGIARQPIFLGLREDKKPTSVTREVPTDTSREVKKAEGAAGRKGKIRGKGKRKQA